MKKITIFLFTIFSLLSFSQNNNKVEIYLDENSNEINEEEYKIKLATSVYSEKTDIKNDNILNRLSLNYEIGQFNTEEFQHIKNSIKNQLSQVDFEKNIILIYQDTLKGVNDKNLSLENSFDISDYLKQKKKYDSKQNKCKRFARKNNAEAYHIYSEAINYDYNSKNYQTHQITESLKHKLFKNESYGVIIIKTNGDYFYYKQLNQLQVDKMLNSDWSNYIMDFKSFKTKPVKENPKFVTEMINSADAYTNRFLQREAKKESLFDNFQQQYKNQHVGQRTITVKVEIPHCYSYADY
ncbi:hypothetical protein [Winogradskyella sp. PE311]|uniref:hypothetical protein n=1 Tax=Winogradskyella sp. PE311 TaxID=3366943 RepID=UPI00397FC1BC